MRSLILAAALCASSVTSALAYTTYLKPDAFWVTNSAVTVEGAFANEFFTPAVAIAPQLTVLHPSGAEQPFRSIAIVGPATRLVTGLPNGGTYRVSTGEQLGPVTTLIGDPAVIGGWRPLAAGETAPADAYMTTVQTATVADVYVTRGAPTRTVVDRAIGRLAIRPITHPNQVLAAEGFDIEVLFDGAPLANVAVVIYAAGDPDTKIDRFVTTGADGRTRIPLDAAGNYVIATRHRASAPAGAQAAMRSYTTSLTFEAFSQLPAIVPVPGEQEPERRRRRAGIQR